MKKQLKAERGLTLIEILAATVISLMVILIISTALLFGLKQYKNQSTKAEELTDVTVIAKIITKDIRRASEVDVENDLKLKLKIDEDIIIYEFNEENSIIFKNGKELSKGINKLKFIRPNESPNMLRLIIESIGKNGKPEDIDTKIYIGQKVK